jgi:hypothetical protein
VSTPTQWHCQTTWVLAQWALFRRSARCSPGWCPASQGACLRSADDAARWSQYGWITQSPPVLECWHILPAECLRPAACTSLDAGCTHRSSRPVRHHDWLHVSIRALWHVLWHLCGMSMSVQCDMRCCVSSRAYRVYRVVMCTSDAGGVGCLLLL